MSGSLGAEHAEPGLSPKVLYVAGWGRSGTTILDGALGQLEGYCSVGELRYIWDRGLQLGWRCGCGEPLPSCPFWSEVLHGAFGGSAPDPARMTEIRDRELRTSRLWVSRSRRLHRSSSPRGGAAPRDGAALYGWAMVQLYRSVASVAGARVIVDSSKFPSDAYLLAGLPAVELSVLQMVRDPRATAYSWARVKPSSAMDGREMPKRGPLYSSSKWVSWNAAISRVLRPRVDGRFLVLRYEDFVAEPGQSLRAITRLAGEQRDDLPLTGPSTLQLEPTHSVSGNPRRFSTGTVELRLDDEWRSSMRTRDRLLATVPAVASMRRYGYDPLAGARQRSADRPTR